MSSTARPCRPARRLGAVALTLGGTLLVGCGVGNNNDQSREYASGVEGYTGAIDTVAVSNVVLYGPVASGSSGQGYLYVTNNGAAPDELTSISTPAASSVQLYAMDTAGGWQPESSLALKPGPSQNVRDHAFRMQLTGLTTALGVGRSYPLTLTFQKAGSATLSIPVAALPTGLSPLPSPSGGSTP